MVEGGGFGCCCLAALLPALVLRLEMTPAHGSAYKKRGDSTKTLANTVSAIKFINAAAHAVAT